MTNLPNEGQNNLVSFLRCNRPIPPHPSLDLEESLFDALEPQANLESQTRLKRFSFKTTWTIPGTIRFRLRVALATGFLFTSVSFGMKTPRIALEPKDLENFLVKNWQDTLDSNSYMPRDQIEAYWLLPTISEPQPTLSVSAQ